MENNIHVLSTDKPSRLYLTTKEYIFEEEYSLSTDECQNQNIYITNDEEIKEGDWVYCTERKLFGKVIEIQLAKFKSDTSMLYFEINNEEIWCKLFNCKKIILTTDQDLIKDGIQSIDDDFLEWFVKNPNCEKVEINEYPITSDPRGYKTFYEIIIPKEELKEKIYFDFTGEVNGLPTLSDVIKEKLSPKEEPKQETLEEAMESYLDSPLPHSYKRAVEFGAKWQQKRMYSEEDMREAFIAGGNSQIEEDDAYGSEYLAYMEDWFEQFKKK